MRKYGKVILITILVGALAALIYWQLNKKQIIRESIERSVLKGSDSTYSISYDSSQIDEIGGNATFYNLRLQSDSLINKLKKDSSQLKKAIVNISVKKLRVSGVNVPGLLQKSTISANRIEIEYPFVDIIQPPGDIPPLSREDTLELYERITGKFSSIKAGKIEVRNGAVRISKGTETPHTIINGIQFELNDVTIDSSNKHENLISYFIENAKANVDSVLIISPDNGRSTLLEGIIYDAAGKKLSLNRFTETEKGAKVPETEILHSKFVNLSTNDFIRRKEIRADTFSTSGGKIAINYKPGSNKDITREIGIDNEYFNKIFIKNIRVDKTDVSLYNTSRNRLSAKLKQLKFEASGIDPLKFSFNIPWILNNSNWVISGTGIVMPLESKEYKANIGSFKIDKSKSTASFEKLDLVPTKSDEAFMRLQPRQKDHYRISLHKLTLSGLDMNALLSEKSLIALKGKVQPDLFIYNDRTLQPDLTSKVGRYPHQLLQQLSFPISINELVIQNGKVNYRERGAISKKTGDVFFTRINGTISNLTNIKERINRHPEMRLNANSMFLGFVPLKTLWKFPMNKTDGSFTISTTISGGDAKRFNVVTEPLGMAKIKEGILKSLTVDMKGDDYGSAGSATVLYNDLKIIYLEEPQGKDTINRKTLLTFIANIFTKDDNPSGGSTRTNSVGVQRDTTRSFFNLVWKSIFEGVKKTAAGKSM